ncbi:glycosyl transferase family 2 [Phocaeicola salanitronis DSM 18170]|uniref:Glycosyl transferase family 2 n=1 Tax=Phocaeicola salanitronis (strain DSM 18170 / JCM 13657 / CCUG 60908 / BL78) TaxID=667015 RepID=F0R175_PHOSB|nr:glycosyltransferase family 2 protein [Phocaeicola salanitronis]ADY36303.1 glycosyl transferase family 2 [Phocaeicola salanitronis DSM 18170]
MDVSVIIVNYNTKSITNECIKSVISQTKDVSYEIILVDNNSQDGSIDYFSNDKRICFIKSNRNIGFGRANNLALKRAKGKYIFLLNSDTILLNDAISIFYEKMEKASKNIACIGAYLLDKNFCPNQSYGEFLTVRRILKMALNSYSKKFHQKNKQTYWGKHYDWMEVEMVIGADLFIRKEVIDKLGMFDETFFMYHEENDMQRRFNKSGYKMALILGPQIIHLEQASSSTFTLIDKKIMSEKGMFNYMRNWTSQCGFYFLKTIYIILKLPMLFDKRYSLYDVYRYLKFLINIDYKR